MKGFTKPPLSTDQQMDLLLRRGMQIRDRNRARHYLHHINYYRLRAYWLPFEVAPANDGDHKFRAGTDFDTIVAIYDFDRELRLLLLDAIERIEVSLRTRWANELGLRYGALAHTNKQHFSNQAQWQKCMDELQKEYERSKETFAEHFRQQYRALSSPPIWVACELMTLGHLSRWLQNIRIPKDRQAIADAFGLDEKVLVSFIHHLTIVRNHCAHHGRVWNRKISLKMRLPTKKPSNLAVMFNTAEEKRIYNTLTMLAYLLPLISPQSSWRHRIKVLIANNPHINVAEMGFPPDWQRLSVWAD